jgi:hypothetical protein
MMKYSPAVSSNEGVPVPYPSQPGLLTWISSIYASVKQCY